MIYHLSMVSPSLLNNNTNKFKMKSQTLTALFHLDIEHRTCDVSHAYGVEQNETNSGLMDNFISPSHPTLDGKRDFFVILNR
jgi:hypothetical protein